VHLLVPAELTRTVLYGPQGGDGAESVAPFGQATRLGKLPGLANHPA